MDGSNWGALAHPVSTQVNTRDVKTDPIFFRHGRTGKELYWCMRGRYCVRNARNVDDDEKRNKSWKKSSVMFDHPGRTKPDNMAWWPRKSKLGASNCSLLISGKDSEMRRGWYEGKGNSGCQYLKYDSHTNQQYAITYMEQKDQHCKTYWRRSIPMVLDIAQCLRQPSVAFTKEFEESDMDHSG